MNLFPNKHTITCETDETSFQLSYSTTSSVLSSYSDNHSLDQDEQFPIPYSLLLMISIYQFSSSFLQSDKRMCQNHELFLSLEYPRELSQSNNNSHISLLQTRSYWTSSRYTTKSEQLYPIPYSEQFLEFLRFFRFCIFLFCFHIWQEVEE